MGKKKTKDIETLTKEWLANPDQELKTTLPPSAGSACVWTEDHSQLKEVLRTNKELHGYGNSKKFITVYYGELK